MVAVKMFWDMWKNLTSATTNWSFAGGSGGAANGAGGGQHGSDKSKGSSKPTRYNRLQPCSGPSKSQSHPANLMSFASNLESSSSSSSSLESLATATSSVVVPTLRSIEPTTSAATAEEFDSKSRWKGNPSSSPSIPHSFSSTFPLTSATIPTLIELKPPTLPAKTSTEIIIAKLQPPPALPPKETEQILNQAGTNETPGRSLDSGQGSCWTTAKDEKKVAPGLSDFSDLEKVADDKDEDGEGDHEEGSHTCEVCNRAFPTFKKIADHQRKKRHYGCIHCDSIFPSREVLECHREQMCHYECGDARNGYDYDEDEEDDSDSFQTEDDENGLGDYSEDCDDEERERLL